MPLTRASLRWGPLVLVLSVVLAAVPGPLRGAEEQPPTQGWLGVQLVDAVPGPQVPARAQDAGQGSEPATAAPGVRVYGVIASSPAEDAGLRGKDRILAMDGLPVSSAEELSARLKGMSPGSWTSLTVLRRGRQLDLRLPLAERPASMDRVRIRRGWIGVDAIDLPPSLRQHFGAPEGAGVMVSQVVPGSPAEAAGIRVGDVLFEADGDPVGSRVALVMLVSETGIDNPLEVRLVRWGAEMTVEPRVSRVPEEALRD